MNISGMPNRSRSSGLSDSQLTTMKKKRREFLKFTGLTSLGIAGAGMLPAFARQQAADNVGYHPAPQGGSPVLPNAMIDDPSLNMIGQYGAWAAGLVKGLPTHSYRRTEYTDLNKWRQMARKKTLDRMAIPEIGGMPEVRVDKIYVYDGLQVEELSWQLPYGGRTQAIVLKPAEAKGSLPAILALHDHGGNKYFGCRKITRVSDNQHPMMVSHQAEYYEKRAWANEIAKRGYVVMVPDAFPFGSRRVLLQDVPVSLRRGFTDDDPENPEQINKYNFWAGEHEHIMAKALFCAGTTWPGVYFGEDRKALDILCARKDVNAKSVGCAGLSGGGMRTVYLGGLDARIRCAVTVGFMTTWRDFLLNKCVNHTWMAYVPLLPNELDFPEILGLRVPLPTMVLNDEQDDLYTMPEMKRADGILGELFQKAGMPERYKCSYYAGPHKFDAAMQEEAFGWFDKWLRT